MGGKMSLKKRLKTMGVIGLEAILHPTQIAVIDIEAGKIIRRYRTREEYEQEYEKDLREYKLAKKKEQYKSPLHYPPSDADGITGY